jgi:hypothetical protein
MTQFFFISALIAALVVGALVFYYAPPPDDDDYECKDKETRSVSAPLQKTWSFMTISSRG